MEHIIEINKIRNIRSADEFKAVLEDIFHEIFSCSPVTSDLEIHTDSEVFLSSSIALGNSHIYGEISDIEYKISDSDRTVFIDIYVHKDSLYYVPIKFEFKINKEIFKSGTYIEFTIDKEVEKKHGEIARELILYVVKIFPEQFSDIDELTIRIEREVKYLLW